MPRRQRGVSLFEMVVVVILVMILILVAITRLMPLFERVERTAFELDVAAMRRGLGYELSRLAVAGRFNALGALEGSNPMALLAEMPRQYLGELSSPEPAAVPPGSWYFDSAAGELIYRPRHTDMFRTELDGPARIRYRIRVRFEDRDADGVYRHGVDELRGVSLASPDRFEWGERGSSR